MFNGRLTFIHQISKDFIQVITPNGANMHGVRDMGCRHASGCISGESYLAVSVMILKNVKTLTP